MYACVSANGVSIRVNALAGAQVFGALVLGNSARTLDQFWHDCRQKVAAAHSQVKDINVSKESPCGHGIVTCFSIYGGSSGSGQVCNFAADASGPPQDRLWVDTMLDDQVWQSTSVSIQSDRVQQCFRFGRCKRFATHCLSRLGVRLQEA